MVKTLKEGMIEIEKGDKLLAKGSMLGKQKDDLIKLRELPIRLFWERKTEESSGSSTVKGETGGGGGSSGQLGGGGGGEEPEEALGTAGGGPIRKTVTKAETCPCCADFGQLQKHVKGFRGSVNVNIEMLRKKVVLPGPAGPQGPPCRDG